MLRQKKSIIILLSFILILSFSLMGCGGNEAAVEKGTIIGVDPGAGIMRCSQQAIDDYDLDFEVMEGSGATMTAALKSAIDKEEWIVVTGWTPHWKFARWDLKYLDDPKKSFGEEEHIDTVVRQGLKEDKPEVYELFDNFAWTADDLSAAMILATEEGATSPAAAHKWVEENEELVNSWLPEAYKSGDAVNKNNEKVNILYVEWSCATATSYVIADILENKMGYEVELISTGAALMFEGLANGDGDAIFCSWLPVTHGDYMEKVGDKVENLGPNMHGAKIGLVVPQYVTINSIEELNEYKDKFNK